MPFELLTVTEVTFTNANPRAEFHGEEHVRAIDISISFEASNELLDTIEPGLLVHHYTNRAAKAGQDQLPEMIGALPNLRHPKLPTSYRYAKDEKPRGYQLEIDHGLGDRNIVLDDCVRGSLGYELIEGGTVRYDFTLQNNGEALRDNDLYGRLAALASVGKGHILLRAPVQLTLVRSKGWRSGKPDTPAPKDGGGKLFDQAGPGDDDHDDDDTGNEHPAGSPEAALAASVNADLDKREQTPAGEAREVAWPFPNTGEKAKRRKATGAAA